jgi:competence protein ComEA
MRAILWMALVALPALAQTELPAAPGKDVVERVCTTCHGTGQMTAVRRDREHWQLIVDRMQGMGAKGSDADFKLIVRYLAANLGAPDAPPHELEKVNVNKAAGWRIARALDIPPEEGDKIAAYREEHGDFKSSDDLAKVVDPAKIAAAKDRITF